MLYQFARPACFLGKYRNKRVSRFRVVVRVSNMAGSRIIYCDDISAYKPNDALQFVKDELIARGLFEPFELFTWGSKGGEYTAFAGYYSIIGGNFQQGGYRKPKQLAFAV